MTYKYIIIDIIIIQIDLFSSLKIDDLPDKEYNLTKL